MEDRCIVYQNGDKIDLKTATGKLIIDQIYQYKYKDDIDKIKSKLKNDSDVIYKKISECRKIEDSLTVISSPGNNELTKVQGPVWEYITNYHTNKNYIRYVRTIEFVD